MAPTPDIPRSLRDGRYAVIGLLAEGSQGATLDAVDKRDGRPVAIKRFQVRGARSWKDVELAEREARVLRRLSHPALPAHVEHFEEGGALYLVMEKIEGETLAALRHRHGSLDRTEVLRFLHDVASVLDYLHGHNPPVIHRDIKPGNVIRRPDGSYAVVDFGSVRDRLKPKGGSTVVGTFGYMAPEQFQGRALPASDVYAVGATAITLLSGVEPEELPHQGLRIDVGAALPNRQDAALARALQAMLEPNPDQRATALGPLLAQLPRPAAASPRGRQRRGRRPDERAADAVAARGDSAKRSASSRAEPSPRAPAATKRGGPVVLPPLIALVAVLGLVVARIGVSLSLRVVVPLVLAILSLVFGRSLARAAGHVRDAGRRAGRALRGAQQRVRGRAQGARGGRRRGRRRGRGRPNGRGRWRHADPTPPAPSAAQGEAAGAAQRPPASATTRQRIETDPPRGPRVAAEAPSPREDAEELQQAFDEIEDAFAEAKQELKNQQR